MHHNAGVYPSPSSSSGSDPERMSPPNVESYLRETFNGTSIKMNVVAGHTSFTKDYPLFAAVDRCSDKVCRFHSR